MSLWQVQAMKQYGCGIFLKLYSFFAILDSVTTKAMKAKSHGTEGLMGPPILTSIKQPNLSIVTSIPKSVKEGVERAELTQDRRPNWCLFGNTK